MKANDANSLKLSSREENERQRQQETAAPQQQIPQSASRNVNPLRSDDSSLLGEALLGGNNAESHLHHLNENDVSNENIYFTQSLIETSNSELCAQVKLDHKAINLRHHHTNCGDVVEQGHRRAKTEDVVISADSSFTTSQRIHSNQVVFNSNNNCP